MLQGDVACYSFYPSKNLGAVGDAGALVTDRDDTADYVAGWINYGDPPGHKYVHRMPSTNARMDAIQAAFLNLRLGQLGKNNAKRAGVARTYKAEDVLSIATAEPSVWHLYPILATEPASLIPKLLQEFGVEVGRHYPYTLPQVARGGYPDRAFPVAERLAKHVVTLPIGPHVTAWDARYVANSLKEIAQLDDEGMWRLT
jgi:dTDP-4-amino-4,6-dideoxygalactose transaminase